jgi:hypothetical protein
MNKHFLMIVFCLVSNTVYPMDNSEPDLTSSKSINLSDASKEKLQLFVKEQLVAQKQIPQNADLTLAAFVLDEGHRHKELGQRYTVKVMASWLVLSSVYNTPDMHVLKPQKYRREIYSYIFDTGLNAAQITLPK